MSVYCGGGGGGGTAPMFSFTLAGAGDDDPEDDTGTAIAAAALSRTGIEVTHTHTHTLCTKSVIGFPRFSIALHFFFFLSLYERTHSRTLAVLSRTVVSFFMQVYNSGGGDVCNNDGYNVDEED